MKLSRLLATEAAERRDALLDLEPTVPGAVYAARELLLGDDDATVRAAAAVWLMRASDRACAPALVDALYDTHPSVRMAACRALAKLRGHEGVAMLRRLALEEPIWWVRRAAVVALARLERDRAIPVLREVLDDPFWRVRHAAARVLVVLGSGHEERVERITADVFEGSDRTRAALRWIERRLGLRKGIEVAPVEVVQPEGLVADPDPAVIAARLEHGEHATPAELALYVGDPHESLRRLAAERLTTTTDVRVLFTASLWLEEPRIPHATATVVSLLDSLEGDVLEELLDEVLERPEARPGLAVWALSFVAVNRRWDRLAGVLRGAGSAAVVVRRTAIATLGAFVASRAARDEDVRADAMTHLRSALGSADQDVSRFAAHALLHSGDRTAWSSLLALSFAGAPVLVRRLLVIAAREARDVAMLRLAVVDDDPDTRARALAALQREGLLDEATRAGARASIDPWHRRAVLDAETALSALRDDIDPWAKRVAFEIAARAEQASAAARIAQHADDVWLRVRAAEVLARSVEDEDLACVLRLTRDPDIAVRAAAADALDLARDLQARLVRVRESDDLVRDAADTWLGDRARTLMADAAIAELPPPRSSVVRETKTAPVPRNVRALGRTGMAISPLVLSGANEPTVASLFGALNAGCNAFFWEQRYRNLTTFLRSAAERGHRPHVICGTYHATERAIRADVRRTLRRLRRKTLDVFLVFWTRSAARLEGEVVAALERLKGEGLVRAIGFSTHDRELALEAIEREGSPWDVVMVRHSAAHPGAEDRLFRTAAAHGVGVLGFSATNYGRLLRRLPDSPTAPATAADCYRYSLAQPGVTACVSAPRGGRELVENLAVVAEPTLDPARLETLRRHGRAVRSESLDFAGHIRRFPAQPEAMEAALDALDAPPERSAFEEGP
jgi:diketogulonate reductase-like aldo/keto reductase